MMHWFGPFEFGPVSRTNPRADIPVGEQCEECNGLVVDDDFGIVFPAEDPADNLYYHRDCFLHMLGINPLR